jgi:hypothetical protein
VGEEYSLLHGRIKEDQVLLPSNLVRIGFYDLVFRVLGCRSRGPGSIPGATRFSEK